MQPMQRSRARSHRARWSSGRSLAQRCAWQRGRMMRRWTPRRRPLLPRACSAENCVINTRVRVMLFGTELICSSAWPLCTAQGRPAAALYTMRGTADDGKESPQRYVKKKAALNALSRPDPTRVLLQLRSDIMAKASGPLTVSQNRDASQYGGCKHPYALPSMRPSKLQTNR